MLPNRQAEGQSLKFAGNKDQFLFNVEIQDSLEEATAILNRKDIPNALEILESTLGSLRQRQKKIEYEAEFGFHVTS